MSILIGDSHVPYKLFKQFDSREVRQQYFSHRVFANWNSLPSSIAEAQSILLSLRDFLTTGTMILCIYISIDLL